MRERNVEIKPTVKIAENVHFRAPKHIPKRKKNNNT